MIQVRDYCERIVEDFRDRAHFAMQAVSDDDTVLKKLADAIEEQVGKLPCDFRVIRVDLKDYSDFAGLLWAMLDKTFSDAKFSRDDTSVQREDFESVTSEDELCFQLQCVIKEDFSQRGIHVMLMMEHYEEAGEKWFPDNFGWMRGLQCDTQTFSVLVLSRMLAMQVSEEPRGSSAFYNIFHNDNIYVKE